MPINNYRDTIKQWVFGPMGRVRTNEPSDQWHTFSDQWFSDQWHFFGPMGLQTNGFSDQWVVAPMGFRTNVGPSRRPLSMLGSHASPRSRPPEHSRPVAYSHVRRFKWQIFCLASFVGVGICWHTMYTNRFKRWQSKHSRCTHKNQPNQATFDKGDFFRRDGFESPIDFSAHAAY